ncbi:MAG TPA: hypothetical protein VEL31_21280 [Ktedonobacteraceae bacterium]|nr:hypothetical protein [Ktedonobacteraceae bacterium]
MTFNEWYVLIVSIIAILAVGYLFHRIFSPFRCTCGNRYWLTGSIKKHLLHTHKWT